MRICIVSSRLYPQVVGSGTSAHLMAMSLALRGHEVAVVTDTRLKEVHMSEELPYELHYIDGLEDFAMGETSFRTPTQELHKVLSAIHPDVLHVCNFMPMMLVSMIRHLLPFPVVFTFYNTPVRDKRSIGYFERSDLDLGLASFIIKSNAYERLITGSEYYYETALRLGADNKKTSMSHLGVDAKHLLSNARRYDKVDESEYLGDQLQKDEEYILLPSRITKQKGILEAVKSLAIINRQYPIKLLLTGMARPFDEIYAQQVYELAAELGVADKIIRPNKVIPRYLLPYFFKKARLVIVPSHYEGLGLSAIEALLLGVPLVASDTVGLNEVITHEENGLMVRPGDHEGLSAAVLQTLNDVESAERRSDIAMRTVEKFDIDKHIDFVEGTYKELVTGKQHE